VVLETLLSESGDAPHEAERATLYLHTGGLEGLESQLDRYRRAGMLE
jgi:1-aminocyclopropane-1-carboxylate deaminase/D-cysteine desulfhydrase-like pyridoxal-dependent ACC family enzyme